MKRKLIFLASLLIFFLLSTSLVYAVPKLISYQGVLNDSNGIPISSTVSMTFRIYDVETGGTVVWTETQSVPVSNGVFNVKLGSVQPLPSSVFQQDTLYLGIQVASDIEMTPRQQITTGSYAHKAELVSHAVPIGAIMAWAKNLTGVPAISDGWVECNGQILSDHESLLDGTTLPDLNGTNSILKGSTTSGAAVKDIANPSTATNTTGNHGYHANHTNSGVAHSQTLGNHSHSLVSTNMTNSYEVVWIMKIK